MATKCKVCDEPTPTRGPMRGDDVCSTRCAAKLPREEIDERRAALEGRNLRRALKSTGEA